MAPLLTSGPRSQALDSGTGAQSASRSSRARTPYEAAAPDNCTSQDASRPSARGRKAPPHTLQLPEDAAPDIEALGLRNYTSQDLRRPQRAGGGRLPSHSTPTPGETNGGPQTTALFHPPGPRYASGGKKLPVTHAKPRCPHAHSTRDRALGPQTTTFPGTHSCLNARAENGFLGTYKNSQKAPRPSLWRPQRPLSASNYNSQNALRPQPPETKRSTLRQQLPERSAVSAS